MIYSDAVAFWSQALGYQAKRHEDHFHLGSPKDDVQINIQTVTHEPRVHIDFETDDIEAEVARLESLGAKRIREGRRWVVMQTPDRTRHLRLRHCAGGFSRRR